MKKATTKKSTKQYTIRGVPEEVDRMLRQRAKKEGRSLNEIALEGLAEAAGVENGKKTYHDLDHLIGTWEHDPAVEEALAAQRVVDEEMWR